MGDWPLEIADEEAIVRGILSPYHVSTKGKLKRNAYLPAVDNDAVSVMRSDWIGADACKHHTKELVKTPEAKYMGLAVLRARRFRQEKGLNLVDVRKEFKGHAHIQYATKEMKGEPQPSPELRQLREQAKSFADAATYFPDPKPDETAWLGPSLQPKEEATTTSPASL